MEEDKKKEVEELDDDMDFDINFHFSPKIVTSYVNEVAIQTIQTSFVFSFFEFRVPLAMDKKKLEESAIDAVCVGRIALSMEKIPIIIETLQKAYDRLIEERKQEKDTEDGIIE